MAARSSAETQSVVMDSSRSSCTCHWLSNRLSERGGREGTGGPGLGVCVCVYVCVLGLRSCSEGALIGMSELHGVCVSVQ